MLPIAAVVAATTILKETGLGEFLGRKLAGDKGAEAAEKILHTAQAVTGITNPEELVQTLQQDKQRAHEVRLRLLDSYDSELRLEFEDRSSARQMQATALAQEDIFSKRFVYVFALGWSTFAVLYIAFITFMPIPESNIRFADTCLGFLLGTVVATMFSYFYGSSRLNQAKDSTINTTVTALAEKMRGA